MAYQATVIPVMIASPGDVSEEREAIRSTLHDWNDINSMTSQVMLAPVGWDSHSSPELGARPQELINTRLLKDCDLLIGVFWTRLGSPTGKAQSGTVEEIQEHLAAGKPAMIYFSSKPAAPDSIDSEQFAELRKFKDWCKSQGLIESFDNIEQFRSKLSKQLHICLSKNQYLVDLLDSRTSDSVLDAPPSASDSPGRHLSEDAKELLKAAATRDRGTITKITYLSGRMIQTGGQNFSGDRGRESARWEAALDELEDAGLVVARGHKGQVFELTHEGWRIADEL